MRHGTSGRRQRNRGNSARRSGQARTQVYDSNGPDVRIRGTAHQVAEKYLALAKDASVSGDIVVAENYYQHAEHYIRIIGENNGQFDASKILGSKSQDLSEDGNEKQDRSESRSSDDDLGLPDSIIGADVAVESKSKVIEEAVD